MDVYVFDTNGNDVSLMPENTRCVMYFATWDGMQLETFVIGKNGPELCDAEKVWPKKAFDMLMKALGVRGIMRR